MSTEEMHKRAGLGLCTLVALITILVGVKMGRDMGKVEFSTSPSRARGIPTGEPAPEFALKDLAGNEVRLADQRGQVVLVDFWATTCPPCRKELPHIQRIHEKYQNKGLMVLAISTDSQRDEVRPYVEKNGYTFPVLFADGKVRISYRISGIPVVYLIDRKGVIRFHQVGYGPGAERRIERQVEKLLQSNRDLGEKG